MAVRERAQSREDSLNFLLFEFLGKAKKDLDKILKGHQSESIINGIYKL